MQNLLVLICGIFTGAKWNILYPITEIFMADIQNIFILMCVIFMNAVKCKIGDIYEMFAKQFRLINKKMILKKEATK